MHLDSTFLGVHLDSTFLGVHMFSMFLGVHFDSTFLVVHLDNTFLSCGLDLAKGELQSSWWTRARRYRNSSGRLGMGNPGAVEKFLVPLQDLREKDPLIWVVQGSRWWRREILGSWRGLGEECCQGGGW